MKITKNVLSNPNVMNYLACHSWQKCWSGGDIDAGYFLIGGLAWMGEWKVTTPWWMEGLVHPYWAPLLDRSARYLELLISIYPPPLHLLLNLARKMINVCRLVLWGRYTGKKYCYTSLVCIYYINKTWNIPSPISKKFGIYRVYQKKLTTLFSF